MKYHRSFLVAILTLALSSIPASATDTVVAHVQSPSAIRAYAGIQVFSSFEGTVYHIAILRHDEVELVPVAPSQAPFDVDIGPDRKGRPQLIYTRCKGRDPGTGRAFGCDLFTFSLADGSGEKPVTAANTSANEIAPTLWKGRIAFARESKDRPRAVVFTRALDAPRSRSSERLPAIPRRARRERITDGRIAELELHGGSLAQIVNLNGGSASEVRLVDITNRSTRLLAGTGVGEAGQYFAGIGFASGYLAWTFGGAIGPDAGIFRRRLATRELSHAPYPRVVEYLVIGLALFAPDGAYIVDWQPDSGGCGEEEAVPPAGLPAARLCQVIRSQPLRFRAVTHPPFVTAAASR